MRALGLPSVLAMLDAVAARRYARYGLAVMRMGYAAVVLALLALNWGDRQLLWGPGGAYDLDALAQGLRDSGTWTVFALARTPVALDVLLLLTAAVAVALALGWRTRVAALVLWVLFFSLYFRTPSLPDGGDNLMRIVLGLLPLTDAGAVWSLDARRRARRAGPAEEPSPLQALRTSAVTALHNTALAAMVFQVFVVYVAASMYKVQGPAWQAGTAVYFPLRVDEFAPFPALSALVWDTPLLLTAATYGAVFLQLAFPLAMLSTASRRLVLVGVLGLHLGIGLLMGIPLFSASVLFSETVLVSDRSWQRLVAEVRSAAARLAAAVGARQPSAPVRSAAVARRR